MIKKLSIYYKKYSYYLWLYCIFVLSIILRVYNFQNRIGVGGDSGRDAMIAQVALSRHELPLFASFSSAGPFVFGPLFYWFNMLSYILNPFTFEAPWIITCMVGIITVMAMAYIGYITGGKRLSLLLGLLVACSPQFIARSTFLSQHGLVGVFSTFLLLFFILFFHSKKIRYAFLMGLSLGIAISMHYQALNLVVFFPILLFIPKTSFRKKLTAIILMFIGFIIPALPFLYWDSHQSFANINNVLDYLLIGQYRIYVANSWKLYLFQFLPDYWSDLVGGNKPVAFIVMTITGISFAVNLIKKNIKGEILSSGVILAILLFIIRYYRGERFEGYLIYIAPFIFLLSAWSLLQLYDLLKLFALERKLKYRKIYNIFYGLATGVFPKKDVFFPEFIPALKRSRFSSGANKRTAVSLFTLLLIVILGSDLKNASQFIFATNPLPEAAKTTSLFLMKKYPGQKFAVYDYLWKTSGDSYALSLYLKAYGRSDPNGYPIGIIGQGESCINPKIIVGQFYGNNIIDMAPNNKDMINASWTPVNAENIYDDLITRWTTKQKLKTTFSLPLFILNKFRRN